MPRYDTERYEIVDIDELSPELVANFQQEATVPQGKDQQYDFSQEGILGTVGRQFARSGQQVASGLGGLPGTAAQAIGQAQQAGIEPQQEAAQFMPEWARERMQETIQKAEDPGLIQLPTISDIQGSIKSIAPEGYFEPQNKVEKTLDRILPGATMAAISYFTGGAPFWSTIMREVISGGAGQAAEEAGYGAVGQMMASIGSAFAFDVLKGAGLGNKIARASGGSRKIVKDKEIRHVLNDARRDLYEDAYKVGTDVEVPTKLFSKKFEEMGKELRGTTSGLPTSIRDNVWHEYANIKGDIQGKFKRFADMRDTVWHEYANIKGDIQGKFKRFADKGFISGDKLLARRRHLNNLIGQTRNPVERRYLERMSTEISDLIKKAPNEEFVNLAQRADDITSALKMTETGTKFLEKNKSALEKLFSKSPFKWSPFELFSLSQYINPIPRIRMLYDIPEARKYMYGIMQSSLLEDRPNLLRSARGLSKVLEEKSKPKKQFDSERYEIIDF